MAQQPDAGDDAGTTDVLQPTDLTPEDLRDADRLRLPDGAVIEILDVRHTPRGTEPHWTVVAEKPSGHPVEWHEHHVENLAAAGARPIEDPEPLPDATDLTPRELHQRIALEAVANDDPARALTLALRSIWPEMAIHPRQHDVVTVRGKFAELTGEWLDSSDFSTAAVDYDGAKAVVRGISYDRFQGEYRR